LGDHIDRTPAKTKPGASITDPNDTAYLFGDNPYLGDAEVEQTPPPIRRGIRPSRAPTIPDDHEGVDDDGTDKVHTDEFEDRAFAQLLENKKERAEAATAKRREEAATKKAAKADAVAAVKDAKAAAVTAAKDAKAAGKATATPCLKRPAAAAVKYVAPKLTPAELVVTAKRYKKHDFAEFVTQEGVESASTQGAFTSRAYDRVVKVTGDSKLGKAAYAAALGAWHRYI
jgi:hypothetical protein